MLVLENFGYSEGWGGHTCELKRITYSEDSWIVDVDRVRSVGLVGGEPPGCTDRSWMTKNSRQPGGLKKKQDLAKDIIKFRIVYPSLST